jgi:hypothetical protein
MAMWSSAFDAVKRCPDEPLTFSAILSRLPSLQMSRIRLHGNPGSNGKLLKNNGLMAG